MNGEEMRMTCAHRPQTLHAGICRTTETVLVGLVPGRVFLSSSFFHDCFSFLAFLGEGGKGVVYEQAVRVWGFGFTKKKKVVIERKSEIRCIYVRSTITTREVSDAMRDTNELC